MKKLMRVPIFNDHTIDSHGNIFLLENMTLDKEVPLTAGFGAEAIEIGKATITQSENQLYADLEINNDHPAICQVFNRDHSSGSIKLWPAIALNDV